MEGVPGADYQVKEGLYWQRAPELPFDRPEDLQLDDATNTTAKHDLVSCCKIADNGYHHVPIK